VNRVRSIVIGASSGGLSALSFILERLPGDFKIPVLIVQHLHPESEGYWINLINKKSMIEVKEAENMEPIKPGYAYIAPPDYHLLVDYDETIALSKDEKVNHSRPSIDVLFETAADVYGKYVAGIVLTGTNDDGVSGLKMIKKNGGLVIVQDPEEAEYKEMPQEAIKRCKTDFIFSLQEIVEFLKKNR
jgi:two-component system, chemotaxis family, protein-glutamate methylesterase/glutaminase